MFPSSCALPRGLNALEYYGPEPDRWRERTEPGLNAAQAPEHFMDMEYLDVLGGDLPRRRYDFVRALAFAQKSHPDLPLSPEKVGLQPYVIGLQPLCDHRGVGAPEGRHASVPHSAGRQTGKRRRPG